MVNFAIVGCGHISKKHIEAIEKIENARLVAVCDSDPTRLKEFQHIYGIPGYENLKSMLESEPCIHVINICVPSGLHAPIAIQAAEAQKHIIVEKPIALTLKDAEAIIQACNQNRVKLSVVHPNRFRPAVMALKSAVNDRLFGKLSHANATVRWNRNQEYYDQAVWRGTKEMDGGVLMNQAIHNLDLLLWLVGPVVEVQAYAATRLRQIETEDVITATLKFEDGSLGIIEAASTVYPKNYEESISIFGETGTAVISGHTANWIKQWVFEAINEEAGKDIVSEVNEDPYGIPGHQHIIRDMIEAIETDREPIVSGEDGRNALKLVLAVYEAAKLGRSVRLSDI